jgi:hypothetical protein
LVLAVVEGALAVLEGVLAVVVGTELAWGTAEVMVTPLSEDGTCEQTAAGWLCVISHRSPIRYPADASRDFEVGLVPEVM